MNGLRAALAEANAIVTALEGRSDDAAPDVMICPPATMIAEMAALAGNAPLLVGAQDCHAAAKGAHTGDISAEMLRDAGAIAVIVGHSERRADHGELDRHVLAKAEAAYRAGLIAIICVGETDGQRRSGLTRDVVARQLKASTPDTATPDNTVIAYEPVWAIGTGLTPTPDDVAAIHTLMRSELRARFGDQQSLFRLLYGGSVNPKNAKELMAVEHVDGALVGGASLTATDFLGVIAAYD